MTIQDTVTTKYQRDQLIHSLDLVMENLFSNKTPTEVVAQFCTAHQKEILVEILGTETKAEKAKEQISSLRSEIALLQVVTFEVAVDPSDDLVKKLSSKLELALKKKVVLDFQQKNEILGGAVIEYGGKYGDFSLRKKIGCVNNSTT